MGKCILLSMLIGITFIVSCSKSPIQHSSLASTDISAHSPECPSAGSYGEHRMEYIVPLDEGSSTMSGCPFVALRGRISRYTFPGPPNFESIENGDYPETRWILEIPKSEIQRLEEGKILPEEYFSDPDETWRLQLIPPTTESDTLTFVGKSVVVEGYLGTLCFHVHARITIEGVRIYCDERKEICES